MILDAKKGVTLQQVCEVLSVILDILSEELEEYNGKVAEQYAVPDDVLDALENKETYAPEDIPLLARAIGMNDRELLSQDELPADFSDRTAKLFELRKMFRPKEMNNASTDNTTN